MKKLLTFLMTFVMVVSLLPATAFAANNTATTMRLAKTQGTVTVTNATGKNVKQTGNMKLYNGYKVKTGAKSYVWISLDDTKVAKLDANSVMEVQKKGKDLALYLSSGNMFFNVKDPLKSGETFSIKTSTMTTGIRGTSGCVRVISPRVTEIHLLTGEVQVYAEHPVLGLSKTATLKAGQKATSLIDWEAIAATGEMVDILIERLENHQICGVCSEEIANDPELLERIEREAPHLLPEKAAAEAEERIAADEAAAEEEQAVIEEAVAEQVFPEDVDPYFEEESGGGGGGGGTAAVSKIVNVATWAELLKAIQDYNAGSGTTQINLTANIDSAGETTELPAIADNGALILNLGRNTLTLNDSLVNEGNLTITNVDGYIIGADIDGFEGSHKVEAEEGSAIINYGTLTLDDGQICGVAAPAVYNKAGATFTMTGGELMAVAGAGENYEALALYNAAGATANLQGGTVMSAENQDGIYNYGTLTLGTASTSVQLKDLYNAIYNYEDAVLTMQNGTIADCETGINNYDGTVTLGAGAVLQNLNMGVWNESDHMGATLNINGATFDGIAGYTVRNIYSLVYQTDATIRNAVQGYDYIENDRGYVNISGGDICAENTVYGVNQLSGSVVINGGTYDIYGAAGIYTSGSYNENNEGVVSGQGMVTLKNGAVFRVHGGGAGIVCDDAYEGGKAHLLILNGGSIIAEDADAIAINAIEGNTELYIDSSTVVKAKEQGTVITDRALIPEGYEILPAGGYYMLAISQYRTITTATELVQAVAAFDGTAATTLTLDLADGTTGIIVSDEVVAAAAEAAGMELSFTMNPSGAQPLTIDLNGYALGLYTTLTVKQGELIITDSGQELGLAGSVTASAEVGIDLQGGSTLTMESLDMTAAANCTGIRVGENATLTVNSGYYGVNTNVTMFVNNGEMAINGGTLAANNMTPAGLAIQNNGDLTMNGGSITTSAQPAVNCAGGSTFEMTDGTISTYGYIGAGVELMSGAEATLKGGTIKVTSADGGEAGVSVAAGAELTVSGTQINVSNSDSSGSYGNNYGIYWNGGTMQIESGLITAESAKSIALYDATGNGWDHSKVKISENATIQAANSRSNVSNVTNDAIYTIPEDTVNDYYVLQISGLAVSTAEDLYNAVQVFNTSQEHVTVYMMNDIDFAAEGFDKPLLIEEDEIGFGYSFNLMMQGHDLNLTSTMKVRAPMVIDGGGAVKMSTITLDESSGDDIVIGVAANSNNDPDSDAALFGRPNLMNVIIKAENEGDTAVALTEATAELGVGAGAQILAAGEKTIAISAVEGTALDLNDGLVSADKDTALAIEAVPTDENTYGTVIMLDGTTVQATTSTGLITADFLEQGTFGYEDAYEETGYYYLYECS